jgi:hypothetical protein
MLLLQKEGWSLLLQKEGWSRTAACVRYQYNRMPVKWLLSYSSYINILHCDRNQCVYLEVLFTGEPISPTFQYYVQDWGSGSDLSVSSGLLGNDAVLLGKQFPDFSRVRVPSSSRHEGVLEGLCSKCWELPHSQWHSVVSHETPSTEFQYCLLWWYGVLTLSRFLPYLHVLLNRKLLWPEQNFCIFNSASRMNNLTVMPLRDTYFDQGFAQCSSCCTCQYIPGPWLLPSILCIIWFDVLADSSLNC